MYSGGRRTSSIESRRTSTTIQDGLKVKAVPVSSPSLKPKSTMLVMTKPAGDITCYQTQIANVSRCYSFLCLKEVKEFLVLIFC